MELILHWISEYGYFGIFALLVFGIVGLPVPDETLLTFAGYLVYGGRLQLAPAMLSAFLGSVCGITISYTLGRLAGYLLIEKYGPRLHIKMERVRQVHDWFHRVGRFALTLGYYVPGIRHLTAYVAGASELEMPVFALFAYTGALLWSSTFILLGYFLGNQWNRVSGQAQVCFATGVLALAGLAAVYFLWRRRKSSPRSSPGRGTSRP